MFHAVRGISRESSSPHSHTPTQQKPKASEMSGSPFLLAQLLPKAGLVGKCMVFNVDSKS